MEGRASKLQEDIDSLLGLADDCVYLQILDMSVESLQLKLFNPFDENGSLEVIFNFSTSDYPEGTVVSHVGPEASIQTESKPLLDLIAIECYAWCKKHKLETPRFAEVTRDKLKEETKVMEVEQRVLDSQNSMASAEYTEASDDEADYGYEDMSEDESYVHPLLEREVTQVSKKFGSNSIETRIHAGIDEMDLFFNIDMNNFLDSYTASAWRVNLEMPLVILLHIRSVSKYLDGVEPQVEVFQEQSKSSGEKIKAGMGLQLKKIMEAFVNTQWKTLNNAKLEDIFSRLGSADDLSEGTSGASKKVISLKSVPAYERQASLGAQMSLFSDLTHSQTDKNVPSIRSGFLVQFLQYALHRIQSLNEFCVICDEKHVLETGLLKPCVCTRELCVFAFQSLGVMADAAEAIATDADVVDLLIAMANAAGHSTRCKLILDPFPSIVDPADSNKLALDPKEQDFNLVRTVLKDVVKCRELVLRGRVSNLRATLDGFHKLAFPLMQWIIATCRAHIVLLPQARLLKSMKTKYQFLLISSPPKKEVAFKNAKEKHGSRFAFHGSNIENWHSIMRKGLINATGTQFQLHGAAHGSGVYLSPKSNVSFGYTSSASLAAAKNAKKPSETECLAGKLNLRCLALCEVVTTKDLKTSGDVWVCPNPDNVCTRFFFVYDTSTTVSNSTDSPEFKKEIDHAMAYMKAVKAVT